MIAVGMKHVFISHSSNDDALARRVRRYLERSGIECWYSLTDLEPGVDWDDNIVAALDRSIAVVLVFSAAANNSKWVKRELAMAGARNIPIYPVRIEDVKPTGGMEAHLVSVQWIDVFNRPVEPALRPILSLLRDARRPEKVAPQPLPASRKEPPRDFSMKLGTQPARQETLVPKAASAPSGPESDKASDSLQNLTVSSTEVLRVLRHLVGGLVEVMNVLQQVFSSASAALTTVFSDILRWCGKALKYLAKKSDQFDEFVSHVLRHLFLWALAGICVVIAYKLLSTFFSGK